MNSLYAKIVMELQLKLQKHLRNSFVMKQIN